MKFILVVTAMYFFGFTVTIYKAQDEFEFGTYQIVALTMLPFNIFCSFNMDNGSIDLDIKM
jgi:hypothetical protein